MERLLELLKDGRARSLELIAIELDTSKEDIKRQLEFLENIGAIHRVSLNISGCSGCSGCSKSNFNDNEAGPACKGCIPEGGFQNMGEMWEVCK